LHSIEDERYVERYAEGYMWTLEYIMCNVGASRIQQDIMCSVEGIQELHLILPLTVIRKLQVIRWLPVIMRTPEDTMGDMTRTTEDTMRTMQDVEGMLDIMELMEDMSNIREGMEDVWVW
jgi:hypothetical protein